MAINFDVNKDLKLAMLKEGWGQKEGAEFLGVNIQIFNRKINHSKANGFNHRFNEDEKFLLKERFNCEVE